MRIFKYELEITYKQMLPLRPKTAYKPNEIAEPLSVAEQDGKLMLWALVTDEIQRQVEDDDEIKHEPLITIIGTGNPFQWENTANKRFLGTVVMSSGLVWHVFCEKID